MADSYFLRATLSSNITFDIKVIFTLGQRIKMAHRGKKSKSEYPWEWAAETQQACACDWAVLPLSSEVSL